MTHTHFLARRQRLLKAIGDGVAIVPTAPEAPLMSTRWPGAM